MYFITTKRMLEVCFSVHPNIQYRTKTISRIQNRGCGSFLYYKLDAKQQTCNIDCAYITNLSLKNWHIGVFKYKYPS